MDTTEYMALHKEMCDSARELSRSKNADYASPDSNKDDPLAVFRNFMQCEHLCICTVEQGFLVRLSDKFSRLVNLLRPGHERAVSDETEQDTMLDIINYVNLLHAYRVARAQMVPYGREAA